MNHTALKNYLNVYLKELSLKIIGKMMKDRQMLDQLKIRNMYIKGGRLIEDYIFGNLLLDHLKDRLMVTNDIDCYINLRNVVPDSNFDSYLTDRRTNIIPFIKSNLYESMFYLDDPKKSIAIILHYITFIVKSFGYHLITDFFNNSSAHNLNKIFSVEPVDNMNGKLLIKVFLNYYDKDYTLHRFAFIDFTLGIHLKDIRAYDESIYKYLPDKYETIMNNINGKHADMIPNIESIPTIQRFKYRDYAINNSSFYLYLLSLSYLSFKHIPTSYFASKYPGQSQYYKSDKSEYRLKTLLKLFETYSIEEYARINNTNKEFNFIITSGLFKDKNNKQISSIKEVDNVPKNNAINIAIKSGNGYPIKLSKLISSVYRSEEQIELYVVDDISKNMEIYFRDKILQIEEYIRSNWRNKSNKLHNTVNIIKYYSINSSNFSINLIKYYLTGDTKHILKTPLYDTSKNKPKQYAAIKEDPVYDKIKHKVEDKLIQGKNRRELNAYGYFESLKYCFELLQKEDISNLPFLSKLPEQYYVYRGMNNETYANNMIVNLPKRLEDLQPGDIINSDLFLSTSTSFHKAKFFTESRVKGWTIFKIKLNRDDRVIFMNNDELTRYKGEYEVLLPCGSQLVVDDIKYYRDYAIPNGSSEYNSYTLNFTKERNITKYLVITCSYKAPDVTKINILDNSPYMGENYVQQFVNNSKNIKNEPESYMGNNRSSPPSSPPPPSSSSSPSPPPPLNSNFHWLTHTNNLEEQFPWLVGKTVSSNNKKNENNESSTEGNNNSFVNIPLNNNNNNNNKQRGGKSKMSRKKNKGKNKKNSRKLKKIKKQIAGYNNTLYNNKHQAMSINILAPFQMYSEADEGLELAKVFSEIQASVKPNDKIKTGPSHDELVAKLTKYFETYPDAEQFLEFKPEDMGCSELEEFIEFVEKQFNIKQVKNKKQAVNKQATIKKANKNGFNKRHRSVKLTNLKGKNTPTFPINPDMAPEGKQTIPPAAN